MARVVNRLLADILSHAYSARLNTRAGMGGVRRAIHLVTQDLILPVETPAPGFKIIAHTGLNY